MCSQRFNDLNIQQHVSQWLKYLATIKSIAEIFNNASVNGWNNQQRFSQWLKYSTTLQSMVLIFSNVSVNGWNIQQRFSRWLKYSAALSQWMKYSATIIQWLKYSATLKSMVELINNALVDGWNARQRFSKWHTLPCPLEHISRSPYVT